MDDIESSVLIHLGMMTTIDTLMDLTTLSDATTDGNDPPDAGVDRRR